MIKLSISLKLNSIGTCFQLILKNVVIYKINN